MPSLKTLLERDDVTVAGKQVGGDVALLKDQFGIDIKQYIELVKLAKTRKVILDGRVGLAELCRIDTTSRRKLEESDFQIGIDL